MTPTSSPPQLVSPERDALLDLAIELVGPHVRHAPAVVGDHTAVGGGCCDVHDFQDRRALVVAARPDAAHDVNVSAHVVCAFHHL